MQIVRFVVVVGWRQQKQAPNSIFKVVFCTNNEGNLRAKRGKECKILKPQFFLKNK
jgi:hypothetical protein